MKWPWVKRKRLEEEVDAKKYAENRATKYFNILTGCKEGNELVAAHGIFWIEYDVAKQGKELPTIQEAIAKAREETQKILGDADTRKRIAALSIYFCKPQDCVKDCLSMIKSPGPTLSEEEVLGSFFHHVATEAVEIYKTWSDQKEES